MSANDNTLPEGWASVRVDRVGVVRLGRQRSPDKHTGKHVTKYLRAANIKPNGLDLTDVLEMDFTPAERLVFALRAGDILLTEASGSSSQVGRAALWSDELSDCCYQNTIIRFRSHATLPAYALTVFRHYAVAGIFGRLARGVGIQHLGASRFAELKFPLPPINEQERIAEAVNLRLAEIREAATYLQSALTRLGIQRKEILASAVSGELVIPQGKTSTENPPSTLRTSPREPEVSQESLFESPAVGPEQPEGVLRALPPGWIWIRIDQAGQARLGRQRSPEHHRGKHLRPYLRVANVLEDHINVSQVHEMNFTPEEFEVYALLDGDILLNEGQSLELVGRPAMFRGELPNACFQNHLIRFRAGPAVRAEYALLVFLHYLHSGEFRKIARGSTNIANLGLERFRAMAFPLPPLAEQDEIVKEARSRLNTASSQSVAIRASIDRLPEMERELLAAAVSGELVPQHSDDEPAAQLLERLGDPKEAIKTSIDLTVNYQKKGHAVQKQTSSSKTNKPAIKLSAVLLKAARPLPLPELFALAGFDRDQSEHVELFYLALRSEMGRTIRQTGAAAENAMLEVITDAP